MKKIGLVNQLKTFLWLLKLKTFLKLNKMLNAQATDVKRKRNPWGWGIFLPVWSALFQAAWNCLWL